MSTQRVPKIGDDVWFFPPSEDTVARSNFNKGVVAGKITRVFPTVVSMKIFPDCGSIQDRTSVPHITGTNGATRSWMFVGEYPLDDHGVPIFEAGQPELGFKDTINT